MKVLVTGANGFIGRHCLQPLLSHGYHVVALNASGSRTIDHADVEWRSIDLLNLAEIRPLLQEARPTHLLHLAWCAKPGVYWASPDNLRWVQASLELFRSFVDAGGTRIVGGGTSAEYALPGGHCVEFETPVGSNTLYGTSKIATSNILAAWASSAGASQAWGRIFSLYGPHESSARLISSAILSLLSGEKAQCGNGDLVRDYLHVADVGAAFARLVVSNISGPVNIASGVGVALSEIVRTIAAQIGHGDDVDIRDGTISSCPVLTGDNKRLQSTGWRPTRTLDQGLAETIGWWRQHINEMGGVTVLLHS
jgi:nucleoside-diphosphate-sugar epimerase